MFVLYVKYIGDLWKILLLLFLLVNIVVGNLKRIWIYNGMIYLVLFVF